MINQSTSSLYKRLYKLNSNGKTIQVWEMHRTDDDRYYFTISGQLNGKMTKAGKTYVMPKVNRTQEEQILLEMDSKINLQKRKKYVENIEDVHDADKYLPGYSAMLAKDYMKAKKYISFPCTVQPKLDGVRCLATKDGLFSRGRKEIDSCYHVREFLKPFFEKYPNAMLDGELYAHEFKHDFETIIKAVRKTRAKASDKDIELQEKVQYHIYDCPQIGAFRHNDSFRNRLNWLTMEFEKIYGEYENITSYVQWVHTDYYISDEYDLFEAHDKYLDQGYEGTMVRNTDMPYEGKRSNNLLKLKEFDENEFEIIDVQEGKGSLKDHAAAFVLVNEHGTQFKAKLQGSYERLKWIWDNPQSVIGKWATVAYQGLTNKEGVPRFPIAKDVRGLADRSDWL